MNVAVRLEGLADPGGILISEDAYRQIHDKLEIDLRDRGPLSTLRTSMNRCGPVVQIRRRPVRRDGAHHRLGLCLVSDRRVDVRCQRRRRDVGCRHNTGHLGADQNLVAVESYLDKFWDFAAAATAAIVLLLMGLTVDLGAVSEYWDLILVAIIAMVLARAAMVFVLMPAVGIFAASAKLAGAEGTAIWWGGMRGCASMPQDSPRLAPF